MRHQYEGWTKARTLANFLRVPEDSLLAVVAASRREDGEWYFPRETKKDGSLWISVIESRRAAEARESVVVLDSEAESDHDWYEPRGRGDYEDAEEEDLLNI